MIVILDKRAEAAAIKDSILEFIGDRQVTFPEIHAKYAEHKRGAVSNFLSSLKRLGLIDMIGEGEGDIGKKYIRISNRTFTEVINERLDENNEKRKQSYYRKQEEAKANPNARVFRMDEFTKRSQGNKTKINPWQGYTSFGDV